MMKSSKQRRVMIGECKESFMRQQEPAAQAHASSRNVTEGEAEMFEIISSSSEWGSLKAIVTAASPYTLPLILSPYHSDSKACNLLVDL